MPEDGLSGILHIKSVFGAGIAFAVGIGSDPKKTEVCNTKGEELIGEHRHIGPIEKYFTKDKTVIYCCRNCNSWYQEKEIL
jgi:hypothetical protein